MNGMIMVLVVGVIALDIFSLTGLIHLKATIEKTSRQKKRKTRRKYSKGYFDLSVTDLKKTLPATRKTAARTSKKTAPTT